MTTLGNPLPFRLNELLVGWHVLTNGKGVAGGRTSLATPFGKPQDVPPENLDRIEHYVFFKPMLM